MTVGCQCSAFPACHSDLLSNCTSWPELSSWLPVTPEAILSSMTCDRTPLAEDSGEEKERSWIFAWNPVASPLFSPLSPGTLKRLRIPGFRQKMGCPPPRKKKRPLLKRVWERGTARLRSFLARDFEEEGWGSLWGNWLRGSCLDPEAQSQECSHFFPHESCLRQSSSDRAPTIPDPRILPVTLLSESRVNGLSTKGVI